MAHDNIYNQAGAAKIYFTTANQTDAILADDMGPCKIAPATDTGLLSYTDHLGVRRICVAPVNGVTKISEHYGLFEITEDGNVRLGIKITADGGLTWTDTGMRLL
jgi:hypothetical protein